MAWTPADLTAIETAIRGIVLGGTAASFGGKTYTAAQLKDLWALRNAIKGELDAADDSAELGFWMTPTVRGF